MLLRMIVCSITSHEDLKALYIVQLLRKYTLYYSGLNVGACVREGKVK